MPFASSSVPRHLARGVLGFLCFVLGFAGAALVSPLALVLVPLAFVFLRGCPACWTVGLIQTIAGGAERRACPVRRPGGLPR